MDSSRDMYGLGCSCLLLNLLVHQLCQEFRAIFRCSCFLSIWLVSVYHSSVLFRVLRWIKLLQWVILDWFLSISGTHVQFSYGNKSSLMLKDLQIMIHHFSFSFCSSKSTKVMDHQRILHNNQWLREFYWQRR